MSPLQSEKAHNLDHADPLRDFRTRFHIPKNPNGSDVVYLCGHSLGLQPLKARDYVNEMLDDWKRYGVEGHTKGNHPWMPYHEFLTEQTARLVGAKPAEVVVMNSLTVNLHLMMVSFYRPEGRRRKVLMEAQPFPSDRYAVDSQIRFHRLDPADTLVELRPRAGETSLRTDDILDYLKREGDSVALVLLGGVNYYSGQAFEMERITREAHETGSLVGFDLAHAAGNLVLNLHDWEVDFAVWCSYKYLNGGPGSTAGCFVHERHASAGDTPRFAGWWGTDKQERFRMEPAFSPIPGAEGWQLSNPAILPMAALRASMEIFDEAGMAALRTKSEKLTGYLIDLLGQCGPGVLDIITPDDQRQRGAQLSIRVHESAERVFTELNRRGFICDWREPDIIRVAPVPLYNTFSDVQSFAAAVDELTGCSEGPTP